MVVVPVFAFFATEMDLVGVHNPKNIYFVFEDKSKECRCRSTEVIVNFWELVEVEKIADKNCNRLVRGHEPT
jgi:hypothetical protein